MTTQQPAHSESGDFDVYADQFNFTTTPWGVTVSFGRTPPIPQPGRTPTEQIGVVRMSLEHAKVMSMIMRRQLKAYEAEAGFKIQIMSKVMSDMGLSEEDWDKI